MKTEMSDKQQRLKEVYDYVRKRFDVHTQEDFAESIDYSRSVISSALNGNEKYLTTNLFEKICEVYKETFNLEYLLEGKGSLLQIREELFVDEQEELKELRRKAKAYDELMERDGTIASEGYMYVVETRPRVPLRAANGNLRKWYAGENRHLCEQKPLIQQFPPYQFTLLVSSNSMKPYIDTGDIIACAEISKIVSYGDVYILDTDGEVLIRRVFESPDHPDQYRLVPDNKEYPDILLDRSAVQDLFRVVGLLRVEI